MAVVHWQMDFWRIRPLKGSNYAERIMVKRSAEPIPCLHDNCYYLNYLCFEVVLNRLCCTLLTKTLVIGNCNNGQTYAVCLQPSPQLPAVQGLFRLTLEGAVYSYINQSTCANTRPLVSVRLLQRRNLPFSVLGC